jgi:hypothetical protein
MFGRRQLYVAYELRRPQALAKLRDGYHESVPDMLMGWFGRSEEAVAERTALVASVFEGAHAICEDHVGALRARSLRGDALAPAVAAACRDRCLRIRLPLRAGKRLSFARAPSTPRDPV